MTLKSRDKGVLLLSRPQEFGGADVVLKLVSRTIEGVELLSI